MAVLISIMILLSTRMSQLFSCGVSCSVDFDFVSVLPEACGHEILSRFASLVYFEFGNEFVRAVDPRINPLFDGFFDDAD